MAATYPPFAVGNHPSNAIHLADLGRTYVVGDYVYTVCKAAAAMVSPGGKSLFSTISGSEKTFLVDVTTDPAAAIAAGTYVGTVPAGHANIAAGDYFLSLYVSPTALPTWRSMCRGTRWSRTTLLRDRSR